jgi:hypothetical protein
MSKTTQVAQRLARIKHRYVRRWTCPACKGVRRVEPERTNEIPVELEGCHWCICGEHSEYRAHIETWRNWLVERGNKVAAL